MRHGDRFHDAAAGALQALVERRNQRLPALEAKALGAGYRFCRYFSSPSAAVKRSRIMPLRRRRLDGRTLKPLHPELLGLVHDVHELGAHGPAVGGL